MASTRSLAAHCLPGVPQGLAELGDQLGDGERLLQQEDALLEDAVAAARNGLATFSG
jgi:hypothetical protein